MVFGGGLWGIHTWLWEKMEKNLETVLTNRWQTMTKWQNIQAFMTLYVFSTVYVFLTLYVFIRSFCHRLVPMGLPSCGGDAAVYVKDINQSSLPTPFYSVLVSISVFMALSTVFHSINSPDSSLLSNSILPILMLPYWFCQLYISLWTSPSALI